jgi:hypothetical protein
MLNSSTVVMLMLLNFDCICQLSGKVFYNTTITKPRKSKDKIIPGIPSLLFNGYRESIPGGKARPGRDADLSSAEAKN